MSSNPRLVPLNSPKSSASVVWVREGQLEVLPKEGVEAGGEKALTEIANVAKR